METKLYNIHWYGPFTTPSEINAIQCENDLIYELYLIKGKKPRCKKSHYYCGQSITRGAGKRLFDGNHHIKEYRDNGIEEIWVGYISNPELKLQPTRHDVLLVENILIAYLNSIIGKDYIFDVDKFTAFEGKTGPYILYTLVRIKSIFNKIIFVSIPYCLTNYE